MQAVHAGCLSTEVGLTPERDRDKTQRPNHQNKTNEKTKHKKAFYSVIRTKVLNSGESVRALVQRERGAKRSMIEKEIKCWPN